MNVVKEINKINQLELDLGVSGASWHDEYKDSAYIFVGGLPFDLTEGDVVTIFSQYGEVMDVNMPRDKDTGKPRGFAFLMYEDQRSTVLAVDNLSGAKVLEKTLRVDHVKNYKQPKIKGDDGEWLEPEDQSLNAKPEMIIDDDAASDSSASTGASIDPEDPMRDYLIAQRREAKALQKGKKSKSKGKHKDETPEERKARKARKAEKKARKTKKASEGMRGVEELLNSLGGRPRRPSRSRSRSPPRQMRRQRSDSPRRPDDRRPRSPGAYDYHSRDDGRYESRGGGRGSMRESSRERSRR
ncbi:RNA-binding domain-containing protein [Favolaschia claudopus]|uniref:RNA-binding domain-containing protein n=1 Tax=Favolaschia claudopus TaxID=2862362 RepID=A0AAW0EDQ9_9AGAR